MLRLKRTTLSAKLRSLKPARSGELTAAPRNPPRSSLHLQEELDFFLRHCKSDGDLSGASPAGCIARLGALTDVQTGNPGRWLDQPRGAFFQPSQPVLHLLQRGVKTSKRSLTPAGVSDFRALLALTLQPKNKKRQSASPAT